MGDRSLLDSTMYAVLVRLAAHKRRIAAGLATLGLRLGQELYLAQLWREDGQPQGQLAERLGFSAANVTQVLPGMEAQGLVERRRDDADARVLRVWLTDAGRALRGPVTALWFDTEAAWLADLTPEQREAVARLG